MNKLKRALSKIAQAIVGVDAALKVERAEARRLAKAAQKKERQAHKHAKAADKFRARGEYKHAQKESRLHNKANLKAEKLHATKQEHTTRIKALLVKRGDLVDDRNEAKRELAKLTGKVEIHGNTVTGGDLDDRLQAAMIRSSLNCTNGVRLNRYSQSGYMDLDHCIEGIKFGARDDCSSWGTSVCKSAGIGDPNGYDFKGANWTGSAEAHLRAIGHEVSEEYAMNHPCIALYGDVGRTHHWEWTIGNGTRETIGHGDARINKGVFDLFGDGKVRFYKPVND